MKNIIEEGSVVFSLAGRDKGIFFVVVEITDENFVKVADGKLRKLERPKVKKLRHLKVMDEAIRSKEAVEGKPLLGLTDKELREKLKAFNG